VPAVQIEAGRLDTYSIAAIADRSIAGGVQADVVVKHFAIQQPAATHKDAVTGVAGNDVSTTDLLIAFAHRQPVPLIGNGSRPAGIESDDI
jgi:hypothetical protein